MTSQSLTSIVLAIVLLGLVVPSGAALIDDSSVDDVWAENGIVVAPADGPNGEYAQINSNGKLAIDLSDPGVNKNGKTLIRRVFVIANTGERKAMFWLTHDGNQSITLYENVSSGHIDRETIERQSLHGENQARTLDPGEKLTVSVFVDTTERAERLGPVILETITLHARTNQTTTTTTTTTTPPTTTESPAETPTTTPTTTTTTTSTTTPVPEENETVEVEFIGIENESAAPTNQTTTTEPPGNETPGNETPTNDTDEPQVSSEPVDPDTLDNESTDPEANPTAVITNRSTGQPEPRDRDPTLEQRNVSAEMVTNEGESVDLSATQSYIPAVDRVDQQRKIAAASRITVPPELEDNPATLRFRVPNSKFDERSPEDARVGRRTDQGWQLLETSVLRTTPEYVLLEAQTPGFSTFAVFSAPNVTYRWTLPDGTTHRGPDVRTQFDTPGLYNVSLTVIDAAGRQDTTSQRILVNDNPRISIDAPANISEGERVTLHANVTNRYGNTTVRWRLPNGDTAIGPNVTYIAPAGEHEATATVTDEYGARNATTATLNTAPPGRLEQLQTLIGHQFELLTWLTLVGLTALVVLVLRRAIRTPRPLGLPLPALVARFLPWRRGPRIVEFADPRWNTDRSRFEIPTLSVLDPRDDLDRVELLIRIPGGPIIARKRIELRRQTRYTATPEVVQGIPATAVDPATDYVATVRAINTREGQAADTRAVRWFTPDAIPAARTGAGTRRGAPAD